MKNSVRIIAGRWRGRKLRFPDAPGLRPTPDRVRETLFNWLRDDLDGARCLDLFAGSGALGFEAASRGAARVVLVEADARAARALSEQRQWFGAEQMEILVTDAAAYLAREPAECFDVVFLDPPFGRNFLPAAARRLDIGGWLAPLARIYVEAERAGPPADLPAAWRPLRSGTAGEVAYFLYQLDSPSA